MLRRVALPLMLEAGGAGTRFQGASARDGGRSRAWETMRGRVCASCSATPIQRSARGHRGATRSPVKQVDDLREAVEELQGGGAGEACGGPALPGVTPAHGSASPRLQRARVWRRLVVSLPPLCDVPAGAFPTGGDPRREKRRKTMKPQRRVTLPPFNCTYAGDGRGVCRLAARRGTPSAATRRRSRRKPDHPVVTVSWSGAVADARGWRKTGRALAAAERGGVGEGRARDGRAHLPLGRHVGQGAANTSEGGKKDHNAGRELSQRRSPRGAQEMTGNVWEWTSSVVQAVSVQCDR